MQNEPGNDVNLSVLGTGCATSCGAGCVSVLLIFAIGAAAGAQAVRQGYAVPIVGFLLGLLAHLVVGYVTARAARANNAAVNFHVIIVGALLMIVGLLSWVLPQRSNMVSSQTQSMAQLLGIISWLLIIPVMLLGASWSADDQD